MQPQQLAAISAPCRTAMQCVNPAYYTHAKYNGVYASVGLTYNVGLE